MLCFELFVSNIFFCDLRSSFCCLQIYWWWVVIHLQTLVWVLYQRFVYFLELYDLIYLETRISTCISDIVQVQHILKRSFEIVIWNLSKIRLHSLKHSSEWMIWTCIYRSTHISTHTYIRYYSCDSSTYYTHCVQYLGYDEVTDEIKFTLPQKD